jgi:hypothetical protein
MIAGPRAAGGSRPATSSRKRWRRRRPDPSPSFGLPLADGSTMRSPAATTCPEPQPASPKARPRLVRSTGAGGHPPRRGPRRDASPPARPGSRGRPVRPGAGKLPSFCRHANPRVARMGRRIGVQLVEPRVIASSGIHCPASRVSGGKSDRFGGARNPRYRRDAVAIRLEQAALPCCDHCVPLGSVDPRTQLIKA